MPIVPRAQRTVDTAQMPSGYVTTPAMMETSNLIAGQEKMMGALDKLYQEEVKKVNQTSLLEADNKLSELKLRVDMGASEFKGKDAAGAIDYASKEWKTGYDEIEKGLGNETQKFAARARAQNHWAELNGKIQRHAATERQDYELKTTDAWIGNTIDWTAGNYKDTGLVGRSLSSMDAVLNDFAVRNGRNVNDAEIVALKAEKVEKLHTAVIERMLADGDDIAAKEYFKTHSAAIKDKTIRKQITTASSDGEGARLADEAWKSAGPKTPEDAVNEYDMAQAIEKASGGDVTVAKAGISVLKERTTLWKAQVKTNEDVSKAKIWRAVADGASLTTIKKMPEYLRLDGKEANTVKEHIIDRANTLLGREAEKTTPKQDVAYWKSFKNVDTMTEDAILSLYPTLGRKRTNDLMEEKARRAKEPEETTAYSWSSMVDDKWKELGFDEKDVGGENHAAFKTAVIDQISLLESTTLGGKRKANHEEITAIIRDIATKQILVDVDMSWLPTGTTEIPLGAKPEGAKIERYRFKSSVPKTPTAPIKAVAPTQAAKPKEGTIAQSKTGQKLIYKDGKWLTM